MNLICCLFTLIVTVLLPAGGFIFLLDHEEGYTKQFLAGAYTYVALYLFSVLPFLNQISNSLVASGIFAMIFGSALLLGVVSEASRLMICRYYLGSRNMKYKDALALGFGHWAVEALITVGFNVFIIFLNFSQQGGAVDPFMMVMTGLERLFVLPIMLLLSLLTMHSARTGKYITVGLSAVFHAIFNGAITLFGVMGMTNVNILIVTGLTSVFCLFWVFKLRTLLYEDGTN
ncbi:MAG: YhfC family intramembrane metalloprotease [Clostridia bacterium]|nr:YhfC family intramembrane metalloprotease [Clostridia bacterium]